MIQFLLLVSRQGKIRLSKWYAFLPRQQQLKIAQEAANLALSRNRKSCNFIEWREGKLIYKRYASLYFIAYTDKDDNELLTLEIIHHYVEILDRYFGNVCELDIIFNFHKAYYLLDETLIAGELQETSKQKVLHATVAQDMLIKAANGQDS